MKYKRSLQIVTTIAHALSFLLFTYIVASHLIPILAPEQRILDPRIFDPDYLKLVLSTAFLTTSIGIIGSVLLREMRFTTLLDASWNERIASSVTAVFLACFYAGNTIPLGLGDKLIFAFALPLFLILIPLSIEFFSTFDMTRYEFITARINLIRKRAETWIKPLPETPLLITLVVSSVCLLFSLSFVANVAVSYINGLASHERALRESFYIKDVNPHKVIYAQTAQISGYNFGWGGDTRRFRVMSSYGQIGEIRKWDNDLIIFVVPLFFKEGDNYVWIEKPVQKNGHETIQRSNRIRIILVDRFVFYPAQGDTLPTKMVKRANKFVFLNLPAIGELLY